MVARPGTYQASNNAGELAPEEHGRTDLKQFYSGLAYARNVEPVPQGGSKLSMRTRHLGRVRRQLTAIGFTATSYPAGPFSTINSIVASASFAAPALVSAIVVTGHCSPAIGAIAQLEASPDNVTWTACGPPIPLATTDQSFTAATAPRSYASWRYMRVRLISAPAGATTFALSMLALVEGSTLAPAQVRPFTFSLTQTYVAVFTNNFADFYRDGAFVGCAYTGVGETKFDVLDVQQRFDTMLLFHQDAPAVRILRDASDARWLSSAIPFENIPRVDLGGVYTNQVVDVWQVFLRFPTDPASPYKNGKNLSVILTVNGESTAVISTGGAAVPDYVAIALAIKNAIEALAGVDTGVLVVEDGSGIGVGTGNFTISFDGRNKGSLFAVSAQIINTTDAAASAAHLTVGKAGGEPLIGATPGYASCAAFYQDRLVVGGFRSKLGAFLASVTGEYYDLNVEIVSAAGAILANLDTDGAERLQRIVRSKHLLLFTSDAEYFISDRVLSRTAPPTIVNSSRNGSAADLPILESEGELIYASRNKVLLFAAAYDEVAQAYVSQPISLLASHIANGFVDMARQRPSTASSAARLWMPRADGTVCLGVMLRNQEVTAFVRWETPGQVRRACVDGKNVPHLIVERTVAGVPELHLERCEDNLIFDDVVEQTFGAPQTIVANLGVHEGAAVYADADGYVSGPYVVTAGSITLPDAGTVVRVGRWTPPLTRTLPLPSEVAERTVLRRPKRVHTVKLDAMNTTSVAVGANGRPARDIALARAGDPIDAPQAPVSRTLNITGLTGFSDTGQVEITQTKPGRLAWRGITVEARG